MSQSRNLALQLKQGDIKAIRFVLSQLLKNDMITVDIKHSENNNFEINLFADYDIPETPTSQSVKFKLESSGIQEARSFCIHAINSRSGENLWQYRFDLSSTSLHTSNIVDKHESKKTIKIAKNKPLAIFLAVFIGIFGGHHFYLGDHVKGVLYLLFFWTNIPLILTIFDILYLLRMPSAEFNKIYSYASLPPSHQDNHQNTEQVNEYESEVIKMMDYFKLKELLENNQWHQADRLTRLIMLKLAGRAKDEWLRPEDIKAIPMQDFVLIDLLWFKFSEGYYSFTAQLIVWEKVGSPCFDNDDWEQFGVNVGWRTNMRTWDKWKIVGQEPWRWDSREVGHLPFECFLRPGFLGVGTQRAWLGVSSVCKKLEQAQVVNYLESQKFKEFFKLVNIYFHGMQLTKEDSSDCSVAESIQVRLDKIEEILKQKNWAMADQETKQLLYEITSRQEEGFLNIEHITEFPKYVWIKLDNLWIEHSNGKYGFSAQQRIWQSMGSPRYYIDGWEEFGKRVGWFINGSWIENSEVQYTNQALKGHLPSLDKQWRGSITKSTGPTYGLIIYLFLCGYF